MVIYSESLWWFTPNHYGGLLRIIIVVYSESLCGVTPTHYGELHPIIGFRERISGQRISCQRIIDRQGWNGLAVNGFWERMERISCQRISCQRI